MPEDQNNDKQQNNQPKNKFNWKGAIITLIILGLVSLGIWYFFLRSTTKKSLTYFETEARDAAGDSTHSKYFERITVSESTLEISVIYHNGDKTESYVVGAPSDYINEMAKTGKIDISLIPGETQGTSVDISKVLLAPNAKDNGNFEANPVSRPSPIWSVLSWLIPILFFVLIGWFMWRQIKSAGGGGGLFGPNPGRNKARAIRTNKRFTDIAGNEEVKEEVVELVDYLKRPQAYKAAGARVPKGILLGGPPGTGKTLIAKATAGEAGVPFYTISGSDFVEMYVGVGAARVRAMFTEARKNSPCILFIDELDAVGRSRGGGIGGGNDEREQTLNQLLVEMDGIQENSAILIIAATNRPDVLDPALLRPGRFDRTITVSLPDVKERAAILEVHSRGKRLHHSISFDNVARRTPGFSGAQLENVINEAAILSVREKTGIITPEQIDEAIDRVMAGPAKKSRTISKEELQTIAFHEAGHAVIGIKIPGGNIVQKVTIIPRGQAGGYNLMTPEKEQYNLTKNQLIAKITSFMGGRAAEQIVNGKDNVSTGASNDIEQATSIARNMVTRWGMSDLGPVQLEKSEGSLFLGRDMQVSKAHSDTVAFEIDKEVKKIIVSAEKKAYETINENKKLLNAIASALLERETIVAEEIAYIAKHYKLPPERDLTKVKTAKSIDELIAEQKKKVAAKMKAKVDKQISSTNTTKTSAKPKATKSTTTKKAPAKKKTTTNKDKDSSKK